MRLLTTPIDNFYQIVLMRFVLIDSTNVHRNLKCIALAVPEIIAIGVLFGVVNPNVGVGEEEVIGDRRWYHSKERW